MAAAAVQAIEALSHRPADLPGAALLRRPEIQARVVEAVKDSYTQQLTLEGVREPVDVERVVAAVCAEVADATIDIPRVLVVPIGNVESGFSPFTLDFSSVRYPPVSEELWIQHLRTHDRQVLSVGEGGIHERRLEDYVVRGLVDFDDVSYDEQADLLYEVKVSHGFTSLRRSAYTADAADTVHDYRIEPDDKTKIGRMLFRRLRQVPVPRPEVPVRYGAPLRGHS